MGESYGNFLLMSSYVCKRGIDNYKLLFVVFYDHLIPKMKKSPQSIGGIVWTDLKKDCLTIFITQIRSTCYEMTIW